MVPLLLHLVDLIVSEMEVSAEFKFPRESRVKNTFVGLRACWDHEFVPVVVVVSIVEAVVGVGVQSCHNGRVLDLVDHHEMLVDIRLTFEARLDLLKNGLVSDLSSEAINDDGPKQSHVDSPLGGVVLTPPDTHSSLVHKLQRCVDVLVVSVLFDMLGVLLEFSKHGVSLFPTVVVLELLRVIQFSKFVILTVGVGSKLFVLGRCSRVDDLETNKNAG